MLRIKLAFGSCENIESVGLIRQLEHFLQALQMNRNRHENFAHAHKRAQSAP